MAFYPVLWNSGFDRDDDFFGDFMDPFSFGFNRPMVRRRRPQPSPAVDRKWVYGLKIGDFRPENVKVKVENGKVVVHAKYSEGNDEWGDTVERKRVVTIPDDVEAEKLHSHMRSDGTLMLEAPFKKTPETQVAVVPQQSGALVSADDKNALMKFSVGEFKPEEVKVTCKDGVLTVQGEHQRIEDDVEIKEAFFRQMTVPPNVDQNSIKCYKDENGQLTIQAPMEEDVEMKSKK